MSWEEDWWTIENCQPDLDLFTGDVLKFETDVKNVDIYRDGTKLDSPWGTWETGTNGYLAKVTRAGGPYGITLTPEGKLACSLIAGSQEYQSANADAGNLSKQTVGVVGGIVLGTAAGALVGIPLQEGLLVASVAAVGYAGSLYLQQIVGDEDDPHSETPGSSWTAQGGSQGGSGGLTIPETSYSPAVVRA